MGRSEGGALTEEEEKRTCVRIPSRARIRIERLDGAGDCCGPGADMMPDLSLLLKKKDPDTRVMAEFLLRLDEKLDRILTHLGEDRADRNVRVHHLEDLSGAGMRIVAEDPLSEGDRVFIRIRIPGFPGGFFQCTGDVVRSESGADGRSTVGIAFFDLEEEERERLIAYTFYEQRRQIRNLRNPAATNEDGGRHD